MRSMLAKSIQNDLPGWKAQGRRMPLENGQAKHRRQKLVKWWSVCSQVGENN